MLNLMKSFLLLFHLIILSRFSAFASDQLRITADNVRDYIKDVNLYDSEALLIEGRYYPATTIEEDAFNKLTFESNINGFMIRDFQISTLPENIFATNSWFSKKMKCLTFTFLKLTILPEKIFHPLTEITEIVIDSNDFSSLPSNLFKNNFKLEKIVMGSSQMKTLPIGLFWNNPKLNNVILDNHKLVTIGRGVFLESSLANLNIILYHNYIMCYPEVLKKAKNLVLTHNCLRECRERADCPPESQRDALCKDIDKEPPGIWNQWSNWTSCSKTCGDGQITIRTRTCNHPQSTTDCQGDATEVKRCFIKSCPSIWNQWWSNWTTSSSQTCGEGEMTGNRTCNHPPQGTTDF